MVKTDVCILLVTTPKCRQQVGLVALDARKNHSTVQVTILE